jgi:hypothetical protein
MILSDSSIPVVVTGWIPAAIAGATAIAGLLSKLFAGGKEAPAPAQAPAVVQPPEAKMPNPIQLTQGQNPSAPAYLPAPLTGGASAQFQDPEMADYMKFKNRGM